MNSHPMQRPLELSQDPCQETDRRFVCSGELSLSWHALCGIAAIGARLVMARDYAAGRSTLLGQDPQRSKAHGKGRRNRGSTGSMRLVFLGPPGAGKGTLAALVARDYGIPHISTGDLFRDEVSRGTALGAEVQEVLEKGGLVPDAVTIRIVCERLAQPDARAGYILDGFPRTVDQALFLEQSESIDAVVRFKIPDESWCKGLRDEESAAPVVRSITSSTFRQKPKESATGAEAPSSRGPTTLPRRSGTVSGCTRTRRSHSFSSMSRGISSSTSIRRCPRVIPSPRLQTSSGNRRLDPFPGTLARSTTRPVEPIRALWPRLPRAPEEVL